MSSAPFNPDYLSEPGPEPGPFRAGAVSEVFSFHVLEN